MASKLPRPVWVIGGNRIPFARSNGSYAQGVKPGHADRRARRSGRPVRPGRRAPRRGRRRRRAQAQPRLQPDPRGRARQRARARDARPTTSSRRAGPASRPRSWSPTRSPSARSSRGIAGGVDTTSDAPIAVNEDLRQVLLEAQPRQDPNAAALKRARAGSARGSSCPEIPRNAEPRTGLSMGEHTAITAARVGHHPRGAGRARRRQPPATSPPPTTSGFAGRPRHAVPRPRARPEPAPGLHASRSSRS